MYQSGVGAGTGALVSFGAAAPLPDTGSVWWVARMVLDLAGGLFTGYLLICTGLLAAAMVLRSQARRTARRAPGHWVL